MKYRIRRAYFSRGRHAKFRDGRIVGLSRDTNETATLAVTLMVLVDSNEEETHKLELVITPDDAESSYFDGLIDDLITLRAQRDAMRARRPK